MRSRRYDMRKIVNKAKPNYYHQKALIHKILYLYPDHTYSLEIKPCVWNKGQYNEHEGWPACTLQLVCPFVSCHRNDHEQSPLGRCDQECRDPQMKEAIEAWTTLNPGVM